MVARLQHAQGTETVSNSRSLAHPWFVMAQFATFMAAFLALSGAGPAVAPALAFRWTENTVQARDADCPGHRRVGDPARKAARLQPRRCCCWSHGGWTWSRRWSDVPVSRRYGP